MKIVVGAKYSTTHPDYPIVRVISRRACLTETRTRETTYKGQPKTEQYENYIERGFVCQIVDDRFTKPLLFLDTDGCWFDGDINFHLDQQLSEPTERYVLDKILPRE